MAQILLHPREGRSPRDYALMYAGLGWKVFPVWPVTRGLPGEGSVVGVCACPRGAECDRPGKHPIGDLVPAGVSDATTDRARVEAWWGGRPSASIGIATGAVSGLTVIDADAGEGKPGLINLTRLCAERGGVPSTFAVNTGGGGLHLYFKYDSRLRTGVNVLAEAIDVRNDGGYVIAPPSNHMRGVYKWREERAEIAPLPEWMLNAPQEAAHAAARRRGRPRVHAPLPLARVEAMLARVDAEDRDRWLKVGLLLGRMYVGTPAEAEAWTVYEAWAARSSKFDEDRAGNLARMREQFAEASQAAPRAGSEPLGVGTLVLWAREGGWTPFGDREAIAWAPGDESAMASALVEALTKDPVANRFFNVLGDVRDVLRGPLPSVRSLSRAQREGIPQQESLVVRRATVSGLQCALSERAVLATASRAGDPVAKPIPADLVSMILKDRSADFPTLTGVAEWPMVLGGEVLMRQRGYDPDTGLYFDVSADVRLTEMSAADAWAWVRDVLLADFPFADALHRAGALALLLTMMQRPVMRTSPAFGVTAPQPGTGKSTLVEMGAMAIYGSPVVNHAFSADEEELRKALHALMIAKIPCCLFDNIPRGRALHSDMLAKLITSEVATDRTLGSSETHSEVNSLLLAFTGNNIAFTRDMASRALMVKMNAREANPLRREFVRPDVLAWAFRNRSAVLSALVAIARTGVEQRPAGKPSRFEDFDLMIVGPVLRATGEDVRELQVVEDSEADEDAAVRAVLVSLRTWQQAWRAERNGERWRTLELVAAIEAQAFPEAQVLAMRRFAVGVDSRRWEADPGRALGYAFRAVRDDYKFAPNVLTSRSTKDGAEWHIEGAPNEAPTARESGF